MNFGAAGGRLAMATAAMLIGCSGSANEYVPPATPTELSAYAASLAYPATEQPQDNPMWVAIVYNSSGQMVIHNFANQPISDFRLWINQAYVVHVDRIDANSSRSFSRSILYNIKGNSLSDTGEPIQRVQIQTADSVLYNVQGPQAG